MRYASEVGITTSCVVIPKENREIAIAWRGRPATAEGPWPRGIVIFYLNGQPVGRLSEPCTGGTVRGLTPEEGAAPLVEPTLDPDCGFPARFWVELAGYRFCSTGVGGSDFRQWYVE